MIKLEIPDSQNGDFNALLAPSSPLDTPAEVFSIDGNRASISSTAAGTDRLELRFSPAEPSTGLPDRHGTFSDAERDNILCLLASPDGRFGSMKINSEAQIYTCQLGHGHRLTYRISDNHNLWVRSEAGNLDLNGTHLASGQAARISDEKELVSTALTDCEFLLIVLW